MVYDIIQYQINYLLMHDAKKKERKKKEVLIQIS